MKLNRSIVINVSVILILSIITGGCSNGSSQNEFSRLEQQRDSLALAASNSQKQLDDMNNYFMSISECLDSITEQEKVLLVSVNRETNQRYSRQEMRHRIMMLADIISRQKEKIRNLTDSISHSKDSTKYNSLSRMVAFLSEQLDEKEAQINKLKLEINDKNKSIAELTANVDELLDEITEVNEQNANLSEAVVQQTKLLNEAYILIADKKELQNMGLLSKGNIFKKTKFNKDQLNTSLCQKVDITKIHEIPLDSKKPQILTAAPEGSYELRKREMSSTILVIVDPTAFWSLSNVLVIQL